MRSTSVFNKMPIQIKNQGEKILQSTRQHTTVNVGFILNWLKQTFITKSINLFRAFTFSNRQTIRLGRLQKVTYFDQLKIRKIKKR